MPHAAPTTRPPPGPRSRALSLAVALGLGACGGAAVPAPTPPRAVAGPDAMPEARPTAPASPRALPSDATFAALANAARALDDRRDQESEAGCLVRVTPDALRLEADLAVAVRPLPAPPADLDARLEADAGPVRVLTRVGAHGGAGARLGLVAITTTAPPVGSAALALFVTDRGVYARRSDAEHGVRSPSLPSWILERERLDDVALVVVTAEAGVPIRELASLLSRLPPALDGRVALAVPLEEGTRLPEGAPTEDARADDAPADAALCPEGLPPLPDDAPYGDLPSDRLRAGLAPLAQAASLCVGASEGPGASGGRVVLALRVDDPGRVSAACVRQDATSDPALRACLVRATAELGFDAPGGPLDLELPLVLAPGPAHRQAPICR